MRNWWQCGQPAVCCARWPGWESVLSRGLVPRETRVKRRGRAELGPGLVPSDPEAFDDLRARECGEDLAGDE